MAIEIFHIEWTKVLPIEKALSQSSSKEGGVYIMFRGIGSLYKPQYIGMSKEFIKRCSTHRNDITKITGNDTNKFFISFGLVSCFDNCRMSQDVTPQQLRDIESFFINEIKPAGNDSSTKKSYKGKPLIIFNHSDARLRKLFKKQMTNTPDLIKLLKSQMC
jgi:hypothetical protein